MPGSLAAPSPLPSRWDVFCRVIDNHGDLGVCWRLCRGLAARGAAVRLWCDDAQALAWMAPESCPGVTVLPWRDPLPGEAPADVVIEAFGCDPPAAYVHRMAQREVPPVWINLEYLSAEDYVARSHGLPSPQMSGPGRGLTKWFFYPGFTPGTGGLLREDTWLRTLQAEAPQDRFAFLTTLAAGVDPTRRRLSLFCYEAAPLAGLLTALGGGPVDVLLCPGPAREALAAQCAAHPQVQTHALPWLTQDDYDRLLWACDANVVRGEDSFVRAQWAGVPFVWQIYRQDGGAHLHKLQAFLNQFLADADPAVRDGVTALHRVWNEPSPVSAGEPVVGLAGWGEQALRWRNALARQPDLVSSLFGFVTRAG